MAGAKKTTVTFVSKYKNHTLILEPTRVEGTVNGHTRIKPGFRVKFTNSTFTTEDPQLIKALKAHDMFGIDFWAASEKAEEEVKPDTNPDAGNGANA